MNYEELASGIPLLAQHKKAIDDYNGQIKYIDDTIQKDSEMDVHYQMSKETKEDLQNRRHALVNLLNTEIEKVKTYDLTKEFQSEAELSGEDIKKYLEKLKSGMKIFEKHYPGLMPYEIVYTIIDFVVSVL